MSRTQQGAVALGLWLLLTALLVIAAWLMLFACGIRILGYQVSFCPARAEIRDDGERAEIAALARRVQELERAATAKDQCKAQVPSPIPPVVINPARPPTTPRAEATTPIPSPAPRPEPSRPANEACTEPRDESATTVVVLDGSLSMLLPYDIDPARDKELSEMLQRPGTAEQRQEAARRFQEALAPEGRRRIDRAREAALEVLNRPDVSAAAVTFETCDAIASASGPAAPGLIQRLTPRGGTPIAASLDRALQQIPAGADGRRTGTIVLVTDGDETCRGDPCGTARRIKRENPGIVINVVDVAGWTEIACVARETGGILRRGGGDIDLKPLVQIGATRKATRQCEGAIERAR